MNNAKFETIMLASKCWRGQRSGGHDELMGIDFWRLNTWKLPNQKREKPTKWCPNVVQVKQQKETKRIKYPLINLQDMFPLQVQVLNLV